MLEELTQQVHSLFGEMLDRHGFLKIDQAYNPEAFGNAFITMQGPSFRIRFIKDRGQLLVELGPLTDTQRWHPLVYVLEFLGKSVDYEEAVSLTGLQHLAHELTSNYEEVRDFFEPGNYETNKRAYERLRKLRTEEWVRQAMKGTPREGGN